MGAIGNRNFVNQILGCMETFGLIQLIVLGTCYVNGIFKDGATNEMLVILPIITIKGECRSARIYP